MYGKHYASMYEGSMRGAGSAFFAVWGWIISHMRPDKKHGTLVELNAEILGFVIGEKEEVVVGVIQKMCGPDLKSRSKVEDGRKLIQVGEYGYRVVNGDHYRKIRDDEERRAYQANWQATKRVIDKAVKNGESIDLATLTPAEQKRYARAAAKEKKRREKEIDHAGGCFGATQAVKEGLEKAAAAVDADEARQIREIQSAGQESQEGGSSLVD